MELVKGRPVDENNGLLQNNNTSFSVFHVRLQKTLHLLFATAPYSFTYIKKTLT